MKGEVINLPGLKILMHFVIDFTAVISGPEKKNHSIYAQ